MSFLGTSAESVWENLELLVATCDFGDWDILCIQEGLKNCQANVSLLSGGALVVTGGGGARGSALTVLSPRAARYFRGHSVGETCTGVFLEMTPAVRCVAWHAPTGAHENETYEQSIHEVERCLDELALLGGDSVIVVGADANCQLNPSHTRVGLGIRGEKEAPSQIDFVFCSSAIAAAPMPAWIEGALETDQVPSLCVSSCVMSREMLPRGRCYISDKSRPRERGIICRSSGSPEI